MLIGNFLYYLGLVIGCLVVVGAIGFVLIRWTRVRRAFPFLFLCGIPLAVFVAMMRSAFPTVWVATSVDGAVGVKLTKLHALGTPEYEFRDGRRARLPIEGGEETIVVNDTTRTLRLQHVYYGVAAYGPGLADETIRPGEIGRRIGDLAHVGPNDRPPESVKVSKNAAGTTRLWLTWD